MELPRKQFAIFTEALWETSVTDIFLFLLFPGNQFRTSMGHSLPAWAPEHRPKTARPNLKFRAKALQGTKHQRIAVVIIGHKTGQRLSYFSSVNFNKACFFAQISVLWEGKACSFLPKMNRQAVLWVISSYFCEAIQATAALDATLFHSNSLHIKNM